MIGHRVLSPERLAGVIERLGLYPELKGARATDEIVARMRDDVRFSRVEADLFPAREGRPASAAISFDVGYEGKNPETAWRAAREVASLFAEEDVRFREARWAESQAVLEAELRGAGERLAELDARIAEYASRHSASMPERIGENRVELDRLEKGVERLRERLTVLRERESGMRLRMEAIPRDDPERIALALQSSEARADVEAAVRVLGSMERRRGAFQRRIEEAPEVGRGFRALEDERRELQARHDALRKKAADAKEAFEAEKLLRGERFTVVRAARLPVRPERPDVPLILLAGLLLGLVTGAAWAAWKESSGRGESPLRRVSEALPFPVLVSIPEIPAPGDAPRRGGAREARAS